MSGSARHRRVGAIVAVAVVLAGACAPPTQPFTEREITSISSCAEPAAGGASEEPPTVVTAMGRSSRLIAPAVVNGEPAPLLVSLHPFVLGPTEWEAYSGLAAAASERGYWVLTPRGSEPGPRWAVPGGLDGGPDDIGWIDALIAETASLVCVDVDRIHAAGFSAGAAMAVGLSCELPWRFAAIGASGGANLTSTCPDADPTSAIILHGTADPIAPLGGSEVVFAPPLGLPVDDVVESFRSRNGCDTPTVDVVISATTTAQRHDCSAAELEYWPMRGAGHTWAGANVLLDAFTGPTDRTFAADDAVLDFFDAVGD